MADKTTNYELTKPLPTEFYDIAVQNENMDKIDAGMKSNADMITTLQNTKADLVDGQVPAAQLPSYVDDVIEGYLYNDEFYTESKHINVITPESGKIYTDFNTNRTYRWSGSYYVEISESLALGETTSTAYAGIKGKQLREDLNGHMSESVGNEAGTHNFRYYGGVLQIKGANNTWENVHVTAARNSIVKADASGNLVAAEEGKDFLKPKSTALVNAVYPVGSIYISVTNTNPSNLFGGTWAAFGTGRTLVGVDTTQNEFNTVQKTGGAKTHTLTLSQIPPHSHKTVDKRGYAFFGGERVYDPAGPASGTGYATDPNFLNTGSAGSGEAHNNLQPYITVYMWRRTA